jgi:hypothetical protein
MALQIRRGTDAERTAGGGVVFAEGELIYVTDTDALYVGDGSTAGGIKLTDNAGAVLGSYIVADTLNTKLVLNQNLDLNGQDIVGNGNININGTITATGNVNIGDDANTDTVDFAAKITSTLTPNADSTFDIGTASARWQNGYFTGLVVDGQVDAVAVNADVVADNSTVMVDVSANAFTGDLTGNVTGNVTGDTAGTHTGAVVGNVTGDTTGYHTGDVKGSVYGDDSTPIIDAVNNVITANLTGNITGNVTGDLTGEVKGTGGSAVLSPNTGPADAAISVLDITATGTIQGNLTGNVTGNAAGDHTGTFTGVITATGTLDGDVTGSVFSDGSVLLVDAVAGNIPASVINGTLTNDLTGNVTGDLTGNVFTSTIESSDSSAITVVPAIDFLTTVTANQEVFIGSGTPGVTETHILPNKFSNYNGVNQDGKIYTNLIGTDETNNGNFPLKFDTATETIRVAAFYEGIQVIGDQATSAITLISQQQAGDVSAIKFNVYTGVVGDDAQEEDPANFTDKTIISTEVADFGTPVKFVNMDTTTRNALTAEAGMVIFNTTDTKLQVYTGSAWVDLH